MKNVTLGKTGLQVPAIVAGCMRLVELEEKAAANYVENAVDLGVNYFDHADIYGRGECESLFGRALKNTAIKREDIFVQSKCGIIPGKMYDLLKKKIKDEA